MHVLILGMTESGKSTLAKKLMANYKKQGVGTLVLDALDIPQLWPDADFYTADSNKFLDVYWQSKCCAAFIDEAADFCGQHDKNMVKTSTRGRHYGHQNHYISQRATLLSRTARDQCGALFLFASAPEDCKLLAAEFNCAELLGAAALQRGQFFYTTRFGECKKMAVF